ncbi:MAG TPA: hypothetical protein VGJ70_00875 [Solirubrobacteraceae bacterium]
MASTSHRSLRRRLVGTLTRHVSPERTRRATLLERLTVRRLSWEWLVRLNTYLQLLGKLATALWVVFVASVAFGVDWRQLLEQAVNSRNPVQGAITLVLVLGTLAFVAVRSLIGFARWRLQRELWRRDVERLSS